MALAEAKENLKIRLKVEWQQSYRGGGGGCKNGERKTKERRKLEKTSFQKIFKRELVSLLAAYLLQGEKKQFRSKC